METLSINLTPEMLALVPIVAALLQLVKSIKALSKLTDWFPVIAVGTGIGLTIITKVPDPVLPGIVIGLLAAGGYDFLKGKELVLPKGK